MNIIKKVRKELESNKRWSKHTFCSVRDMAILKDIVNATKQVLNLPVVSSSKPKKQKQLLDSEKKCKADTVKHYWIIDEETLKNLTQSIEDKTLS
jgi:hypothetical protein